MALVVGLLPIVGVFYPMWSIAPRAFGWYMDHQIYHQYMELKQLERRATDLQAPAAFAAAKYQLKAHIRQVAESLRGRPPT